MILITCLFPIPFVPSNCVYSLLSICCPYVLIILCSNICTCFVFPSFPQFVYCASSCASPAAVRQFDLIFLPNLFVSFYALSCLTTLKL